MAKASFRLDAGSILRDGVAAGQSVGPEPIIYPVVEDVWIFLDSGMRGRTNRADKGYKAIEESIMTCLKFAAGLENLNQPHLFGPYQYYVKAREKWV